MDNKLKTTTASKFPNAIIVPFEKGVKGAVANIVENIKDWEDFIDFIDKLEDNREKIGNNIQTIVFDTVNAGYELITPYTLRVCGKIDGTVYKTVGDMGNAKNGSNFWVERDKLFKFQIDRILNMGFSILFLTHLQVKTIKPKKAEPYDVYKSTMSDRLEALIYPLVDFILTGERKEVTNELGETSKKRVLITKGNSMSTAGGRVFIEEDIDFDTEDEAMQKYQEAFKESVKKKLKEYGINEDIDDIAKKQEQEKMEKIKEYIKENNKVEISVDGLIEEFKGLIGKLSDDSKKLMQSKIKELNIDLKNLKNTPADILSVLVEYVKSL